MYWKCSYGYEKDNISQIKISYLVSFFQLFTTADHLPSSYPVPSTIMLSHQPCACPNSGNNLKQYTVVCLKRRQTVIVFQPFWWSVKVLQSCPVPHHIQIQITVNVKKEVTKQSQKERDRCSIGLELLLASSVGIFDRIDGIMSAVRSDLGPPSSTIKKTSDWQQLNSWASQWSKTYCS